MTSAFSRSDFFNTLLARKTLRSGLIAYQNPLSREEAIHLIRRTTFGVDYDTANLLTGKSALEAVNFLFSNAESSPDFSPPPFTNEKLKDPQNLRGQEKIDAQSTLDQHIYGYNGLLAELWIERMKQDLASPKEKLTFFWHDHFATQYRICNGIPATSMYLQNNIFRRNYAGSFHKMLKEVSVDGAMLWYLNGNENISESPNENYARELLELFTIGVGNYTEKDVREAAKILTGWKITRFVDFNTPYVSYLKETDFDTNSKVFFDEIFEVNYEVNQANVLNNSVHKLIDVILDKKAKEAARFMAQKFYRFYVYANPAVNESDIIEGLADELIKNNFQLKPMLIKLLSSEHFFDELNRGVQLKSPLDSVVGFAKHLNTPALSLNLKLIQLGLQLLNPPNVAGWKDYRNWVTTKSLPETIEHLKTILNDTEISYLGNWITQFKNFDDVYILTDTIIELFLSKRPSQNRVDKLVGILLGGAPYYEWGNITSNKEQSGQRVKALLNELIKAPEFYLY